MRTASGFLAVAMLAFAVGACGESAADKAKTTVCDARADMGKQVSELKSLTPSTVTKDAVTKPLNAIKNDLKDISGAQSDLSSDRRSEVEAATKAFTSDVKRIAGELGASLSASNAKAGVTTALQQLEASYQKTFAPLKCA
jgi:hypothetical protein